MSLGRIALRATVGGFFVGHGTQKLAGWFGGGGVDATAEMFGNLGMRPAKAHAVAAGVAEAGGGAGILLGAFTPLSCSLVVATMATAIRTVHGKNGPWITGGGYEYNAVLIAAALTLAEVGPGSPSLDASSDRKMNGPGWAAVALLLGIAGAAGAQAVSTRYPETEAEIEVQPADAPTSPVPDVPTSPVPSGPLAPESA